MSRSAQWRSSPPPPMHWREAAVAGEPAGYAVAAAAAGEQTRTATTMPPTRTATTRRAAAVVVLLPRGWRRGASLPFAAPRLVPLLLPALERPALLHCQYRHRPLVRVCQQYHRRVGRGGACDGGGDGGGCPTPPRPMELQCMYAARGPGSWCVGCPACSGLYCGCTAIQRRLIVRFKS